MSLVRTALRLAAVNTLAGVDASSGPTIANNRVYDSRISDFSPETYPDDAKPTIIVLTDDDQGESLSHQNGGPPFRRNISLVFEFAMVQGTQMQFEEDGETKTVFVPGFPATDAEHEASLDLLEFQILRRLSADPDPTASLFRSISPRSWSYNCHRQVMDNSGVKIAARVLTLVTEVTDDQVQVYKTGAAPTGLDVLPAPLVKIAKALPAGSSGLATITALAAALQPLTVGPFTGMNATIKSTKVPNSTDPSDQFSANFNPPQT
jgi:hypothetical protein